MSESPGLSGKGVQSGRRGKTSRKWRLYVKKLRHDI